MRKYCMFTGFFLTAIASSASFATNIYGLNFNAPTVEDRTQIYSPLAGEIVYDKGATSFYGYDHLGNWQAISSTGLKVFGARVSVFGSGCTVNSQTGSWLTAFSCHTTGDVTFTMTGFTATPFCTCTGERTTNGQHAECIVNTATTQTNADIRLTTFAANSGSAPATNDAIAQLICIGN